MKSNELQEPLPEEQAPWWSVSIASSKEFRRRQDRRASILLGLMGCALLVAVLAGYIFGGRHDMRNYEKISLEWFNVLIVPAWVYAIAGCAKDLSRLDELGRRIQIESMAWTYLTGLTLFVGLGFTCFSTGWKFNPYWFCILEFVRLLWLRIVARRYQ